MSNRKNEYARSEKYYTGVGLDPEVVEFLAELTRQTQRTRSWLINAIVRGEARRLALEQETAVKSGLRQPPVIRIQ